MEIRARTIKNLTVSPTKITDLKEPINKIIKPTQIYYDSPYQGIYKDQNASAITEKINLRMHKRDHSSGKSNFNSISCTCDCHNSAANNKSTSEVSTANSKRNKILAPSPIKLLAREVITRKSNQRNFSTNSMFPYDSPEKNTISFILKRKKKF